MIRLMMVGNIGNEAKVNYLDNGKCVININVAHSEKYKDRDGNSMEKTIWVECAYWCDQPTIAPFLKTGQAVYIEGTPDAGYYVNKQNEVVTVLKMRVDKIQLIGNPGTKKDNSRPDNYNQGASNNNNNNNAPASSGNGKRSGGNGGINFKAKRTGGRRAQDKQPEDTKDLPF